MLDAFIEFEYKRSTRILPVGIKYSMRDPVCGDINYCASLCFLKN